MRIGTYNIFSFRGFPGEEAAKELGEPNSPERIKHFTGVFRELDCDILALQEGGVAAKTIQAIADGLGVSVATFTSPCYWPGHLLSRYKIVESRTFSHFVPGGVEPPFSLCCGAALVEAADRLIWVVVLHLYPKSLEMRSKEAAILTDKIADLAKDTRYIIVLGDFNSNITEDVHVALGDLGFVNAMLAVGGGLRPTIDTAGKKRSILDHIYVSADLSHTLRRSFVVDAPGFRSDDAQEAGGWVHSDHLPVVAELEL